LLGYARSQHPIVEAGEFGADMKVALLNDGPVTFFMELDQAS
jgi:D-tyrosyl-tRNA(Tyr) deacylase